MMTECTHEWELIQLGGPHGAEEAKCRKCGAAGDNPTGECYSLESIHKMLSRLFRIKQLEAKRECLNAKIELLSIFVKHDNNIKLAPLHRWELRQSLSDPIMLATPRPEIDLSTEHDVELAGYREELSAINAQISKLLEDE